MKPPATARRLSIILLAVVGVLGLAFASHVPASEPETAATPNKKIVEDYMEGFRRSDHAAILACLTEDVEWILPGSRLGGKAAFDKEIENPAFTGRPVIHITRLTEENNVVIAEGRVQASRKDGPRLHAAFCDVFEFENGKIRRLTSYLMEIPAPAAKP